MPPTPPFMPQPPYPAGAYMSPPPFMSQPPTAAAPPMPPASADYTQQLFSYLQAWRQYLEQVTGAPQQPPAAQASAAQAPTAQPPTAQPAKDGGTDRPVRPPNVQIPAHHETGSKRLPGSDAATDSNPKFPPLVYRQPKGMFVSQISDIGSDYPDNLFGPDPDSFADGGYDPTIHFNRGPDAPQVKRAAPHENRYQIARPNMMDPDRVVGSGQPGTSEAPAQQAAGTPFHSIIARAEHTASPQVAPRSLYSTPGTATARVREAGETHSP